MLADSKLPTTFWAEAVNIACNVQNRVLVTKPHNKTPYKLFLGRKPTLGFMRPFGCPVTILNTIDHIDKFNGKADERFYVGYSINSKAFRVFNSRTRIVKENLHVQFSEDKPNIAGSGPNWLFDIDALTKSMNYKPVFVGNQSNGNESTKACDDAGKARMETVPDKDYILLPLWTADPPFSQSSKSSPDAGFKPSGDDEKKVDEDPRKDSESIDQNKDDNVNSTNNVNAASTNEVNVVGGKTSIELPDDPNMPALEDIVYSDDDEDVGAEADMNNLDAFMPVSPIPTTRVHKDHPVEQIIGDLNSAPQTRRMTKNLEEHGLFSSVQQRTNHKDFQNCLFACFLSQEEPKKDSLVWCTDEMSKSAFLYGKIEEEVYVCQPPGFEVRFPDRVIQVVERKGLYGLHLSSRAWYDTVNYLLDNGFQRGKIDKTLFIRRDKGDILLVQVKEKEDGIFISQDKYVTEILKKFGFSDVKTANTPMETQKPLLKDEDGEEVNVHLYISMIGLLMYLTSSRPDIMFVVCACARYQVNPKVSHLYAVKRIFKYLKGQPKLGLWYPKDSPFDLVAYIDSDYAGASLDRLEEACIVTMNEMCSSVLHNKLPAKEKDPGSFTIPCQVSNLQINNALADLGASISLMPYAMYQKLGLGEPKPTRMSLELADRLENLHMEVLTEREIADEFPDEHLMVLRSKFKYDEPWYTDFVNYIVEKVVPPNWTFKKRKRFFLQVKTYFWEETYAFKLCADNIMRRCVARSETLEILAHCHSGPTGRHHSVNVTAKKVCEVFDVWGLDFMGPFPQSRGNKYILVAVNYVSKWVEAQALPMNDARVELEKALQRYGVTHKLSTAYHPQSNRQTEVTNRAIKRILERSVGYNPKDWSKKLNDALWAFRTAYKTPTRCTPFRLVYGKACHLPVEIEHKAHWALKQCNMDLTLARKSHLMQLNELAELRDGAYKNTRIYKEQPNKWHDSRLRGDRDFKVSDKVLLYNSRLKMYPRKLKSKWSDLNIIKRVYPYGAIEIIDMDRSFYTATSLEKKSTTLAKYLSSGILAHKLNLENLPSKTSGEFLVLILLISRF
ncbi:putative ribonuclease H-like domain-containing protein [Tanacetum coccineum]